MTHACSCGHPGAPASAGAITPEHTVEEVARRSLAALETLKRMGINHCCGAHLTLAEAAAAAGVTLDDLLRALDEPVTAPA